MKKVYSEADKTDMSMENVKKTTTKTTTAKSTGTQKAKISVDKSAAVCFNNQAVVFRTV